MKSDIFPDLTSSALPLIRRLDPEQAHHLVIEALAAGLSVPWKRERDDPALATRTMGLRFPNPIGMAAGFDKNARVVRSLARLGFGFVEAGTVTPRPQAGNPKPRLFRLDEDRAIINRMGFNNDGIDRFAVRLARLNRGLPSGRESGAGVPVGANIGINKEGADPERDYPELVARVRPYADYIVLNLSSPNTPGLRQLQNAQRLRGLLEAIRARHSEHPPLLIKLAPDLTDEDIPETVRAAIDGGASGLIVTNTTITRPAGLRSPYASETGGLSGRPLRARSSEILRNVAVESGGQLSLIACGGIESGADILERIRNGADLVQIYTSFVFEGPAILRRLKTELLSLLRQQGAETLADIRGTAR
ncbi:quinone-dependent dihydroorotate dehydrogenase [Acetobacter sp. AN02]|uniref:quinone-dependent dihydroorotate dehydrogenase n=1 Tax=Acetobacter sp. AN02 TaxID=2894186 RepID=UPI00243466BD|nr:quinone-dependent dihydroorotate dehydrogenase [Acetobacter sp. AN02]MDG6095205.1 quinone-dependent dihydroorotate dehydrogenase [Acetobacter sp. AN02]